MPFKVSKLWEEIQFPTSGSKQDMICWLVSFLQRSVLRWQSAFIGQMIFWVTLFATGKVWLGWFP